MRRSIAGLAILAALAVGVLPAAADCALFNTLVKEAENGKGFTNIVPFRSGWDLRDEKDKVPAQFAYAGFDVCWIEDKVWTPANGKYGDPRYTCRVETKPDKDNTVAFGSHVAQVRAMGELAAALRVCVQADERFKVDAETSMGARYMMKPELTEMRGLYENPRVWIEASEMDDPPYVEEVPPGAPLAMATPMRLTFTVFGLARDLSD